MTAIHLITTVVAALVPLLGGFMVGHLICRGDWIAAGMVACGIAAMIICIATEE